MYGTLLIQYLNAGNLKTFFFQLKLQYQTFYFFVLDVNQLTVAKMDNFLLLQTIERIPELRFNYLGSYSSDKVPQLTNYSFVIVKTAQAMIEGALDHDSSIGQKLFFAGSVSRKRTAYFFLNYRRMGPRKLIKNYNLCEFYTIFSSFLLFKFYILENIMMCML